MLKEMRKHKGVSLSSSDLASWVVEYFFAAHFEKIKPQIAKSFTDLRKLLRDNLSSGASQEELMDSLRDSLAVTQTNRPMKKTTKVAEIKVNKNEVIEE